MDDLTATIEAAPRIAAWLARHPGAVVQEQRVVRERIGEVAGQRSQHQKLAKAVSVEVKVKRLLGNEVPAVLLENTTKMYHSKTTDEVWFDDTIHFYVGFDHADPN